MKPYQDSLEHILAEMKRLDLMLRRAVILARESRGADVPDEFGGLVISEQNVNQMVYSVDFLGDCWKVDDPLRQQADELDRQLARAQEDIRSRLGASARESETLTLPNLAATCGLSPADVDVLLIALAPELEPRYETLFAYLHDDVTRKRPSADLALNLICRNECEKIRARAIFSADAPLRAFRLIELKEEPYDRHPTLLRRFLKLSDEVIAYLLGQPSAQAGPGRPVTPRIGVADLQTSAATRTTLHTLVETLLRDGADHCVIQFSGDHLAVLKEAADALAHDIRRDVLYADLASEDADKAAFASLVRDAALNGCLLVLDWTRPNVPDAERDTRASAEVALWDRILKSSVPVVVLNPGERIGPLMHRGSRLWQIRIDAADFETRRQAWEDALQDSVADLDAGRLADLFAFSGSRIGQTASLARAHAMLRGPEDDGPTMSDLLAAGRDLTTPNLQQFAIPVEPRFGWDDLVLPEDRMRHLRSIASHLRHRSRVYRDWGFGRKVARGRGISILFSGAPGTGKTMAAEVLAHELSLLLFQIDLSTVVSKYIGETERNLSVIFAEAEMSQSLLFFDEADALFGKRTEVKDAHDRYANMEVNYLLQRIEQFKGLVVLATNFQKNLDDAFLRRLQYVIEFPYPDHEAREEIWKRHFPGNAPCDTDLDFAFLASQFKLAGGSIRNVVVEAAFLAAEEGGADVKIAMRHVIEALKHEHQKQGKLLMKTDLGPYAALA